LAADIESTLGIKTTLLEGHGGIFEVSVNDEIIYSNHKECSQQFVPGNVIKDIGEAISSKNLSKKNLPHKTKRG
jgi:predicted Rdx family selenoprotein